MSDSELLELAAKAAGLEGCPVFKADSSGTLHREIGLGLKTTNGYWNPLVDDGDALRLAVKLRMDIRTAYTSHRVFVGLLSPFVRSFEEIFDEYPLPATRRAIVRAAAEIGRATP